MSVTRPNLTRSELTLDEQSFQGLLAAAFTIQEHNERRRQARREEEALAPPELQPEVLPAVQSSSVCPQCGAQKTSEDSRCSSCGLEELRPGEKLQRNWASMWLMSQEKGLWPERSADLAREIEKLHEVPQEEASQFPALRTTWEQAADPVTASNFLALPVTKKSNSTESEEQFHLSLDGAALAESARAHWNGEESETAERDADYHDASEESEFGEEPIELSASDEAHDIEVVPDEIVQAGGRSSIPQNWADLQVTLRFHRADLYLGIAVFVALLALLWPAASAPKRAALSPWDRVLIQMGIAEAPAPVIHFQGDPGIQVWVDPHTALYYCPGAEPYGKSADGRFSTQHEAQLDRFEPAGRSVCE